jgi:hypothetical protein
MRVQTTKGEPDMSEQTPVGLSGNIAVTEPVKKKRGGRVKGSKNKPKNPQTEAVTEPDAKSLREFIREITTGEEFRNALKARIKDGKLNAGESRLVEKILDSPVERKKEQWQEMLAVATEQELVLLADLMRRAIAARGTIKPKRVQTRKATVVAVAVTGNIAAGTVVAELEARATEQPSVVTAEKLPSTRQALSNQVLSGSEPSQ